MSYQDTVPRIMDIDACDGVTIKENAAKPRTKRRTAAIRFIADPYSTFSLRPISLLFVCAGTFTSEEGCCYLSSDE